MAHSQREGRFESNNLKNLRSSTSQIQQNPWNIQARITQFRNQTPVQINKQEKVNFGETARMKD